jgi:uncharacterized membrane protein YfcA
MRGLVRWLTAANQAQETRVFLLMAVFGAAIGVLYWFVSYETAGTVLLISFGLATAVIAGRLAVDPKSREVRRGAARRRAEPEQPLPEEDVAGGGTGGIDRPFLDEAGRIPEDSIAPFAVGIGAAIASTGLIFGLAPVVAGLLPFLWGAWTWLRGAGDELRATEHEDRVG